MQCPEAIKFYRKIMGGVDLADQMCGLYEYDRKSDKWWKKTFYRLIMMAAVNSWVIHSDLNRKKSPLKTHLVTLAELLVEDGLKSAPVRRSSKPGRRPREISGIKHLPVVGDTRRRCVRCTQKKKQSRTKVLCRECQVPLCKKCFTPYHL